MDVNRIRELILQKMYSYPFMIFIVILIACECIDLVAEITIENALTGTMVADNTRIRDFLLKLGQHDHFVYEDKFEIQHVILSVRNILNVYEIDKSTGCNSSQKNESDQYSTTFYLKFLADDVSILCCAPSSFGNLDIGELSKRSDSTLQSMARGLRIFGLTIVIFMSLETLLRIVCSGRIFIKKKSEVFDAFVVFTSLIIECSFYHNEFESSSTILLLVVPWRIIRIINSFIAAIKNKHKLQIQNLKMEKKKLEIKQMEMRTGLLDSKGNQQRLVVLCKLKGASDKEIRACIYQRKSHVTMAAVGTVASMMLIGAPMMTAIDANQSNYSICLGEQFSEDADINNNVQSADSTGPKVKLSFSDQFQRRAISTPNLFGSTPHFLSPARFLSPCFFVTPIQTQQNIFFPENFNCDIIHDHLRFVNTSQVLSSSVLQNNNIPDIQITEY